MLHKFLKNALTLFLFITIQLPLSAQCAEVHFYRMNTMLQSDKIVLLYQDGVEIARIKKGDRYKAEVCANSQFNFSVKTKTEEVSFSKQSIYIEKGKKYYVKIACPFTPEVATINQKSESKGKKDLRKGSKFNGAVQGIALNSMSNSSANSSTASTVSSGGDFKRTQVVNNFKFDIVNMTKAGGLLTIDYKITNLASDDRYLETCPYMIYFYDDLGTLISPKRTCISNSCKDYSEYRKGYKVSKKYYCNGSSNDIMPSGIPLNGKIIISNINKRATKFLRATVWFKAENPFEINYTNIEFPKVIDVNNPNQRNFGSHSLKLISAKRNGNSVFVQFNHSNNSQEPYNLKIKSGKIFDNEGEQHSLDALSFISQQNRVEKRRAYNEWQKDINAGSNMNFYGIIDNVSAAASEISRITLEFEGFNFSWKNIPIQGSGTSISSPPPSTTPQNYIEYNAFENKVKNSENVIGKKVILEKIYFATGSDEILTNSHLQLNRLAQLMQSNRNLKVEVSGHTDKVGDNVQNMVLSQKRADAIKYYLMGKSIDPSRIASVGKGSTQAISDNISDRGRQQNRRVEIQIVE